MAHLLDDDLEALEVDDEDDIDYLDRLAQAPSLSGPTLSSHQVDNIRRERNREPSTSASNGHRDFYRQLEADEAEEDPPNIPHRPRRCETGPSAQTSEINPTKKRKNESTGFTNGSRTAEREPSVRRTSAEYVHPAGSLRRSGDPEGNRRSGAVVPRVSKPRIPGPAGSLKMKINLIQDGSTASEGTVVQCQVNVRSILGSIKVRFAPLCCWS
jgi:hypothetical protein